MSGICLPSVEAPKCCPDAMWKMHNGYGRVWFDHMVYQSPNVGAVKLTIRGDMIGFFMSGEHAFLPMPPAIQDRYVAWLNGKVIFG